MSYTSMGVNSNIKKSCKEIQKRIKGRLYFAGEHTNCEIIGTATGAYISGYWAAKDVMKDI